MDAAGHVTALVRSADPDRYLATLYAPEQKRRALFALYAFNADVAAIRDRVREPLAGEVRLQWWRDAIRLPAGESTGSPVADELRLTMAAHDLPRVTFENMLEARMFDLYDDPIPDRATLEGYCGETASALMQLAVMVLDREAAERSGEAAGHGGCAQAIAGLLRLIPIHRSRGQCYIPADLLAAAGTSRDEFVSRDPGEGASRALSAMVALAREHLEKYGRGRAALGGVVGAAFLPVALTEAYLRAVEKLGKRALTEIASIPVVRRQWILLRSASRRG